MDYAQPALPTQVPSSPRSTIQAAYGALTIDREPFLRRARDCAALTIPWVMPPTGTNSTTELATPFQSVGARGVNNLTAKLLMALFPPNVPFWKFTVNPYSAEQVSQVPNATDEIEQALVKAEEAVMGEIEASGIRVQEHEGLLHLNVTGNALLVFGDQDDKDDGDEVEARVFHLDQYVVVRSGGKPIRIITKETLLRDAVPEAVQACIAAKPANATDPKAPNVNSVDLYTDCRYDRATKKWTVEQECCGSIVAGTTQTYKRDTFPYVVVRANHISGENYGRGIVEEYLGDLKSLEGLTQAIVEGSAAAARLLFLVNPNGSTDVNTLSDKPNGAFAEGNALDVTVLKLDKNADFTTAANTAKACEDRLSLAFLLNSAVQRDAERVTAEEIRFMAQELEQGLSGVYSLLSKEFQLPVIKLIVARMIAKKTLPPLPKNVVRPAITTGIEALGRGNDLARLQGSLGLIAETLGPEALKEFGQPAGIMERIFTASGVKQEGLIKTPEEVQADQAAAQKAAMIQQLGPNAVKGVGDYVTAQVKAGNTPPQQPAASGPQGS